MLGHSDPTLKSFNNYFGAPKSWVKCSWDTQCLEVDDFISKKNLKNKRTVRSPAAFSSYSLSGRSQHGNFSLNTLWTQRLSPQSLGLGLKPPADKGIVPHCSRSSGTGWSWGDTAHVRGPLRTARMCLLVCALEQHCSLLSYVSNWPASPTSGDNKERSSRNPWKANL